MLWMAALSGNAKIVRQCLPYIGLKPDDGYWNYVLVHASSPEVVQVLLEHGVDPNVVAARDYTILHHVASDYVKDEFRVPFATLLLDAGASLTKRDQLLKSTPLGWACRWGRPALVQLYLSRGADAVEPDAEPWATPLAWATKGGHREIIELLHFAARSSTSTLQAWPRHSGHKSLAWHEHKSAESRRFLTFTQRLAIVK